MMSRLELVTMGSVYINLALRKKQAEVGSQGRLVDECTGLATR